MACDSAMAERRTQKQLVPVLRQILVSHRASPAVTVDDSSKRSWPAVEGVNDPGCDGIQDGAFLGGLIVAALSGRIPVPPASAAPSEVGLDIGDQHLESLFENAIIFLPRLKKRIVSLLRIGARSRRGQE